MFGQAIARLGEFFQSQLIGVPLENPLSYAYVVANLALQLYAFLQNLAMNGGFTGGFF